MPIYEYRCRSCGAVSELFQGLGSQDDIVRCKACGGLDLERLISSTSVFMKNPGSPPREGSCCSQGILCAQPKRCCQN